MTATFSRRCRLLGIVAALALMATVGGGCARQEAGGGGAGGEGTASEGSTAHPAPTQAETGTPVVDDEPRTDLDHEEVVEWTDYEAVSDRRLRFYFPTGTPDCYGSRAVVEEDSSTVRVATIVGTVPDAPENCALVGRTASIVVTTDAPIAGRAVTHLEAAEALPEVP